ncbi:MAG: nucleoside deaminase [Ruminococcaceae bacterium]|nr:nucleoside deaminase [Oscillospiraceae bacterium]
MTKEAYMQKALDMAKIAYNYNEVPVGCIIVNSEGEIIGTGRNRCRAENDATLHAEIEAIKDASRNHGDWRLEGCTMYVTLEPCPMCAGAILNSRISRLVYGAKEPRFGSCGSVINLFMEDYGFSPEIYGGILEDECAGILNRFFDNIRNNRR